MARKQRKDDFEYDVALSFAGEDRGLAKKLSQLITKDGHSVFFDENRRAHLWGKDSKEFERIYSKASRFVMPFISSHYRDKDWTRWEFDTARAEAKNRQNPFLLPVRLDDSRMFGLNSDTNYQDLRSISLEEIASDFDVIMQGLKGSRSKSSSSTARKRIQLLTGSRRRVLGLIATSGISLKVSLYRRLFPSINWVSEIKALKRTGLLKTNDDALEVPASIKRLFRKDRTEEESLHKSWLEALAPLGDHIDIPALQALHHSHLKQFDEAVSVVSRAVESMQIGWWTSIYTTLLEGLTDNRLITQLSKPSRVRLYNTLALSCSQQGEDEKAIQWFRELRRYAKQVKDNWGIGQSYINQGVSEHNLGNDVTSAKMYRSAIEHARETKDNLLLGRALPNLAQLLFKDQPDEAKALLEESLEVRKKAKDQYGQIASTISMGNLHVARQQYKSAQKYFQRAIGLSQKWDSPYQEAYATINNAGLMSDEGNHKGAILQYRQAQVIAKKLKYCDLLVLIEEGLANVFYALGQFKNSARSYRNLFKTHLADNEIGAATDALHDAGICELKSKDYSKAADSFRTALRKGRRIHNHEWIAQCLVNLTAARHSDQLTTSAITELVKRAWNEQRKGHFSIAAIIWKFVAAEQIEHPKQIQAELPESLNQYHTCIAKSDPVLQREEIDAWALSFTWRWKQEDFKGGIEALQKMEKLAEKTKVIEARIHAIDTQGICYQEQQQYDTAIKLHQRALKLAQGAGLDAQISSSSNNLGEAFRRSGKIPKAIQCFQQSEAAADCIEDHESELRSKFNRVQALLESGEENASESLLKKCRDAAKKNEIWRDYIRAWEELGDISAYQQRFGLAERRYRRALSEAKKFSQEELITRISHNLSVVLTNRGKQKESLKMLRPYCSTFDDLEDGHFYYMTLGELLQENGEHQPAIDCWEKAKATFKALGDSDSVATCAAALGDLYEEMNQQDLADEQFCIALEIEQNAELRSLLLVQRLGLLCKMDKEEQVEEVFEEAISLCEENQLPEADIDIHAIYGEYAWGKNKSHKREALKFYITALYKTVLLDSKLGFDDETENSSQLALHIFNQLVFYNNNLPVQDMEELFQDTKEWLTKQIKSEKVLNLLLWPIKVAAEALPYSNEPEQIERVVKEAIKDFPSCSGDRHISK